MGEKNSKAENELQNCIKIVKSESKLIFMGSRKIKSQV